MRVALATMFSPIVLGLALLGASVFSRHLENLVLGVGLLIMAGLVAACAEQSR